MLKIKVTYLQYRISIDTDNFNKFNFQKSCQIIRKGKRPANIYVFPEVVLFCLNVVSTLLLVHYLQISAYKSKTKLSFEHGIAHVARETFMKH